MKMLFTLICILSLGGWIMAQSFIRSELTASLTTPWEMTYGPDNYLWITESGGRVSRVDPALGTKTVVYTAADYFGPNTVEQSTLCFQPYMGYGTLGLTLHPNFLNSSSAFIYYLYSYNSGTMAAPITKFKIVRLSWDTGSGTITGNTDLVLQMPTGYDHIGGRLLAVTQGTNNYLYLTCGDNGISETSSPTCYSMQTNNPNNFAQDPNYKNGKIHRFNIDGTIPTNNPIPGNSFFTRGHRNPQGLMFNPLQNIMYDVEHGDQTDDEINILESGMNYGWKYVRGFHTDNNFPGEANFVTTYTPHPSISGDALKEPMHSWCANTQPTVTNYFDWCTVAPSDGIYYNSTGIPNWDNSLLVVTLKNGSSTDQEVFRFKLNPNGLGIAPSTTLNPNPTQLFGSDQALNGRLRDIAISNDGKTIYLINNFGSPTDKITVYTYDPFAGINEREMASSNIRLYPNPSENTIRIQTDEFIEYIELFDVLGTKVLQKPGNTQEINIADLPQGVYLVKLHLIKSKIITKRVIKQ